MPLRQSKRGGISAILQAGARIGTNALSQGATQAVQSVVSDLLTQAILGGKSGVDWEEALYQGVLGAITGGGFAIAQEAGKGVGRSLDSADGKLGAREAEGIAKSPEPGDSNENPNGNPEGTRNSPSKLPKTTEESVRTKLETYLLEENHPSGGSKAGWFKETLGFTKDNSAELGRQIAFSEK